MERFILRCVASIEHSPASQSVAGTRKLSPTRFLFLLLRLCTADLGKCSMSPFIGGAFVRVFILHLGKVVDKHVIHYFSGPTHHKLTFIHLRQGSLDKCSCRMDLDHVFLHHPYTIRSLNNLHPLQHSMECGSFTKPAVACMLKSASQVGGPVWASCRRSRNWDC